MLNESEQEPNASGNPNRGNGGENSGKSKNSEKSKRASIRSILARLPGRTWDYFLLSLVALDTLLLLLRGSYGDIFLDRRISLGVIAFDLTVLMLWALDLLQKLRKEDDRWRYLATNWYEVIGLIPIVMFRPFLLLRGVKLGIAFYKIGRSSEPVSRSLTREITFRFRDIIVDTIADAVFLQSLTRVEEVMSRLNYAELARQAFKNHQQELDALVKESLHTKGMMGELARVPFMDGFVNRIGGDVSRIIAEVLEAEVAGSIMKEITRGILTEMHARVRELDVERLTSDGKSRRGWKTQGADPGQENGDFAGAVEDPDALRNSQSEKQ